MTKRIVCMFFVALVLLTSFSVTVLADTAGTITIQIVVPKTSSAKGQEFITYFRNIETDEMISFELHSHGYNDFSSVRYPSGEYELVKCVLKKDESIEYEIASSPENLIIDENGDAYYVFRIAEDSNNEGTDEMKKVENQIKLDKFAAVGLLMLVPMLIAWAVLAIIGRKKARIKAIAQLILHLTFNVFGFVVGTALAHNFPWPAVYTILFCICFPYGAIMVFMIRANTFVPSSAPPEPEVEYISQTEMDARTTMGCFTAIIFAILASVLGVISCPVVLVRDIVNIVRNDD